MRVLHRSWAATLLILLALQASAAVPSGFSDATWVGGIDAPTTMTFLPDGRALVCKQTGELRVIKNNSLLPTPMLSLSVDSGGERGLLGVAADPQFTTNAWIYVYYTTRTPAVHNRISRFTVTGDVVVGGSETVLLELDNLSNATNHNGGAIHFGPDGKLYAAVGDNANGSHAQTLSNLLGKMLRLNKDGSIPTDNPFYNSTGGRNRAIWALGLRNPFTFVFRPGSSLMYINDVGQNSWEEINSGVAGANYGWPATEGGTTNPAYRSPLYAYPHGSGNFSGCAITGGAFYQPATASFPSSYVGKYFFADFCNGWINLYDPSTGNVANFASGIASAVDLVVGADGALYYLSRSQGAVRRISYSVAPVITQHPQSISVSSGGTATFTVAASGSPAPTYRWQRNGVDIAGATSTSYSLVNVGSGDNGATFRAIASNSVSSATSNTATLTVTGANRAPTATITQPAVGTTFAGGTVITYAGSGNDPEEGALPASRLTWRVDLHHDSHNHPFIPDTTGASGSFTIPTTGETAANIFYRVHLTVRDAAGATGTTQRDIQPRTATITLATNHSGLGLLLDGQPVTTPRTVTGVVGIQRTLGAPSPQTSGGLTWVFDSWSDGGAATHTIATPSVNTTYTAVYRSSGGGNGLTAVYWDQMNFTGTSVTRIDPTVNFNWGTAAPATGIGPDTYSVRWTGEVQPQFNETYTFHVRSDDGVRLWVNNQLLIDRWIDQSATEWSGTIALTGGVRYAIRMEYFENGGDAVAELRWSSPSTAKSVIPSARLFPVGGSGSGLAATYWDNANFTGSSVTRTDPTVNFNWGVGGPAAGIGSDTFSARWTGEVQPQFSGTYTFYIRSDDGARLWVNNQQLIDRWVDQSATEWSGTIALTAGVRYPIRLEYFENGGDAVAEMRWSGPSTPKSIIPAARLFPVSGAAAAAVGEGLVSGGFYLLTAQCSGKCADQVGSSHADGADIQQWARHEGESQQWRIDDQGNGWYTLTARHSGKVMEVEGASTAPGAQVQQWTGNSNAHQQWRIEPMGGGWYKLTARHSGHCLDVDQSSTAAGARLQQWDDNGTAAQRWSLELVPITPTGVASHSAGDDELRNIVLGIR